MLFANTTQTTTTLQLMAEMNLMLLELLGLSSSAASLKELAVIIHCMKKTCGGVLMFDLSALYLGLYVTMHTECSIS